MANGILNQIFGVKISLSNETEEQLLSLPSGLYDTTKGSVHGLPDTYGTLMIVKGPYQYGFMLFGSSNTRLYFRAFWKSSSGGAYRDVWKQVSLGGV